MTEEEWPQAVKPDSTPGRSAHFGASSPPAAEVPFMLRHGTPGP